MECAFTSCKKQITHESEAVSVALYNAHIATHMTMGADGTTPKTRTQVEKQNIEAGDPLVNWELIMSVFKSLKTSTNTGCLDSDLLELPYKEDDEPENSIGEKPTKLNNRIVMKDGSIWCQRRKLHQMTQQMGELTSRFAERLQDQARLGWM